MIGKLLDRWMWVVDLLIILVFAAFLAAGVDNFLTGMVDGLIRGAVGGDGAAGKTAGRKDSPKKTAAQGTAWVPIDGKSILARNIFDSETGPLDGEILTFEEAVSELPMDEDDPDAVPARCTAPIVFQAAYSSPDWPEFSFVAIQQDGKSKIVHEGGTVSGFLVKRITWRYVFLTSPGTGTCYMDLWNESFEPTPKPASDKPQTPAEKLAMVSDPGSPAEFQILVDKSIKDVSPTEKDIDSALVDYITQNKQVLMNSGRVLPNVEGDSVNGFKVYGIRKTSLWGKLGIHNGDIVVSINGLPMQGPDSAYDAFAGASGGGNLAVDVVRHGQPMTFTFNVK